MRTYQCPEPSRPSSKPSDLTEEASLDRRIRTIKAMSSHGSSSRGQKRSSRSSNTSYTSTTSQTLKSSAYDRDFEQKCIDHGIYMPSQREKPENWQQLQERLARSRPSLSPSQFSDGQVERFCEAETEARDEGDVVRDSLPTILGPNWRDYPSAGNVPFGNIEDMAPDVFKKPKPDLYWGARPAQIDQRVRQDLNSQLVPSTNHSYPAAPNFFLEAKGPDGSAAVKTRQACYDGALGARAMQALQNYGQIEPTYNNNAYTLSSTYHDGTLKMYSHHSTQPLLPEGPANYHMTKLGGWELTGSNRTFREGVSAFRNAREFTTEQRDMLIDRANTVARTQLSDTMSFDEPNRTQSTDTMSFDDSNSQDTVTDGRRLIESDTSVDELTLDHPPAISRTKRQKKAEEPHQTQNTVPIEVRTEPIIYRNTPGRRLSLNGQKLFIPNDCWESASRNGRKVLYNREKNIFTFTETEEPCPIRQGLRSRREGLRSAREEPSRPTREGLRSMQEYFLPSEGISEEVIMENIARYCGSDAGVTTTLSKVCVARIHFFPSLAGKAD